MENNVLGSFNYKGISTLQHVNISKVFKEFLSIERPDRIIEIGTEFGGLTLMLQDILLELGLFNTKIRTYDIKTPQLLLNHIDKTDMIEIIKKDLFSYYPFSIGNESKNELRSFMSNTGVNLILCDGGNKIGEFNCLSDILNENDIIMCHDYIENDDIFNNLFLNKIWNWKEIEKADIIDAINKNNLHEHFYNQFTNVAWGCFIKK